MDIYRVCIEDRDEEGNVYNSDMVYETGSRAKALEEATSLRKQYGTVVIETWDAEEDCLIATTFENEY